jgi:hypothetical protein
MLRGDGLAFDDLLPEGARRIERDHGAKQAA